MECESIFLKMSPFISKLIYLDVRIPASCLCMLLFAQSVMLTCAQLCLTLCDPMDCSLPGSSSPWIFQARILERGCHFLLQGIVPIEG